MTQSNIQRLHSNDVLSAVTIHNKIVYLSGQGPNNADLDISGQTKEVLAKIDALLKEANSDKSKILSAQLFLNNLSDFQTVNQIWIGWLKDHTTPSRVTIQSGLINKWLIEIVVTAVQADD